MSALIIIRTPFQAFLVSKIIEVEKIDSFDLIYFTQNDSTEDKYYFKLLSLMARKSQYYYSKPKRPSILSSFIFKFRTLHWYNNTYTNIFCASIDAYYITSIVKNYPTAQLITFDDGAANIYEDDIYHEEPKLIRHKFYHFLLKSLKLSEIKSRINYHYTVYDGMPNIVSKNKLRLLTGVFNRELNKKNEGSKTYFIGAPFEEVMTKQQISRLKDVVNDLNIDWYVKHPRESRKLDIDAPYLDKNGRIAEEAILKNAQGNNIILFGWFSSVLLNMGDLCQKRTVLLAKDSANTEKLVNLSKDAGCEVILF